jgi:hypothetical protein
MERVGIIFIVPILFIVGMAVLYGDESSFVIVDDSGDVYTLGVLNQDEIISLNSDKKAQFQLVIDEIGLSGDPLTEGFGNELIDSMNNSNQLLPKGERRRFEIIEFLSLEIASKAVQSRFVSLCLIIPEDFSLSVITGLNHRINVSKNIAILNTSEYYYTETNIELIGDFSYARFSEASILLAGTLQSYLDHYWISGLPTNTFLNIEHESIVALRFNEFEIFTPALLVFVLISSSTGVAGIIGYEREQGTIDRLKLGGFSVRSFFNGLTLTQLVTTLSTMTLVLLTLFFWLDYPVQSQFQGILILTMSIFAVLPLLGISLAVAATTDGQMSTYLPSMIAIPLTFLTGNFIPLPHLRLLGDIQLWHLNPFFCIGEALRKIMILNSEPTGFILDIILLIVGGSFIFIIGALIFIKKAYN